MAIIPVKALSDAKSRLKPFLTDLQRRTLVKSMLRRVIRAAREAGAEVWVLGADDSTRKLAHDEAANWCREAGANINESLRLVFEEAWDAGKSPLFLPGDLPYLQGEDVKGLIALAEENSTSNIILSPAKKGGGTNAVLVPRRLDFRLRLGVNSLSRHVAEAHRLGLHLSIYDNPGLARDLDTWQDLQEYEAGEPGFLARLISEDCLREQ